ncbi:MAG TPA: mechanosensitive ion channel family protein [Acidobacteriota bacterium]|nr:mechanosensitive ion channel family protein [Acidobacteriota bacterium]
MDFEKYKELLLVQGANLGLKILGALALWFLGLWFIRMFVRLTQRALRLKGIDVTVIKYLSSSLSIVLKVALVIAVLGFFGVQTTTFAALFAAVGVAIGLAWSGLLSNFAAGIFLIVFRPFKVGDFVSAGGATGTVEELGLFVSVINTPDNIRTIIGNNKIFSDNIQNFSATSFRRVDLQAPLHYTVNPVEAIQRLQPRIEKIPNVLKDPKPIVEILQLGRDGNMIAVRPFCKNQDYWQVYFDTNRTIQETFKEAGYPPPDMRIFQEGVLKAAQA